VDLCRIIIIGPPSPSLPKLATCALFNLKQFLCLLELFGTFKITKSQEVYSFSALKGCSAVVALESSDGSLGCRQSGRWFIMSLPKSNVSFVIPSIHDDLELDCRIHYPRKTEQNGRLFGRGFAIFAHPYAPLGGCYDDPVVGLTGSVLLQSGWLLVTFNFRLSPCPGAVAEA
jgi:hypothetical protein